MNGTNQRMIVSLQGIRCAGCFTAIEGVFRKKGASSVSIDPSTRIATVLYSGTPADAKAYCEAVHAAGYHATLFAVLPVAASD